jgi:hypothetical protein
MRRFGISGLVLGGVALLLWSQTTYAQGSKTPRVGLLHAGDETASAITSGFRQGMKELGYSEGDNVQIEARWLMVRAILKPAGALPPTFTRFCEAHVRLTSL